MNFSIRRNVELSSLDYLREQFEANWNNITLVKTFRQVYDKGFEPPIVSAFLENSFSNRKEIGNTALTKTHSINIHIFATSDGQRIDIAEFIVEKLKTDWNYYEYSHPSGDHSTLQRSGASGKIHAVSFDLDTAIRFAENVDVKDRFRHQINVSVTTSF